MIYKAFHTLNSRYRMTPKTFLKEMQALWILKSDAETYSGRDVLKIAISPKSLLNATLDKA